MSNSFSRRKALKGILAGAVVTGLPSTLSAIADTNETTKPEFKIKSKINQSIARWCFDEIEMETLCIAAKKIGYTGIDLVGPNDWPILQKYQLESTMCNGAELNLVDGFNDPKFHDQLYINYSSMIPKVANAGYKNLICFSGNRRNKSDEEGWDNCVKGLQPLIAIAEKHNVTLVMELLNSKIDHKDYQCNRTEWGVTLAKKINSPNFKLLYDIYHMQIDEGDVIRTIKENHQYIAHYHTAGVPGRHEIDETQELFYPAIMKTISQTGFTGYVGQEFMPLNKDKIAALQKAFTICNI